MGDYHPMLCTGCGQPDHGSAACSTVARPAAPTPNPVDEARAAHSEWSAILMSRRQDAWTPQEDIDEAKVKEAEAWGAAEQAIRQEERSRYEGLLEAATAVVAEAGVSCILPVNSVTVRRLRSALARSNNSAANA